MDSFTDFWSMILIQSIMEGQFFPLSLINFRKNVKISKFVFMAQVLLLAGHD